MNFAGVLLINETRHQSRRSRGLITDQTRNSRRRPKRRALRASDDANCKGNSQKI